MFRASSLSTQIHTRKFLLANLSRNILQSNLHRDNKNSEVIPIRTNYTSSTNSQISNLEKCILAVSSALTAFCDPGRGDMIATLGETTGSIFINRMRDHMLRDKTGRRILRERPRIHSSTIDIPYLSSLPLGTFGKEYTNFLDGQNVTPDTRVKVQYIYDDELAYVMQRYRECHDFFHALTKLPANVEGELALKWFELAQTGMPMTLLSSIFGPLKLSSKERERLFKKYVPWALQCGSQCKFLLNVYYEEHWNKNIDEMRNELGIYLVD
ncbi:10802_t:CDS:2 [Funneliformis caledonium]|uniref:4-hydroxy-3-methoxy-5-polyprenylbenzoate decarboxylase n=1 Tax=Funneliformis caledonium TaxID=1117310 RepID=A0A9N9F5X7_9GLOM|nr:10802_t:CDS:2 [Funneliformis caledonium]